MPASRLVRALAEVLDAELRLPPVQFAERLGRLFDLTQSIAIASAHRAAVAADFEPECADGGALKQEFLSVRNGMVQSVVRSFDRADGTGRIRVPMASAAPAGDWAEDYAPYHRFYSAHQTDVDFRVRRLHALLRDGAAARSPQLARLCALDAALGDSIAGPARKLFAAIPRLLGQHFEGGIGTAVSSSRTARRPTLRGSTASSSSARRCRRCCWRRSRCACCPRWGCWKPLTKPYKEQGI